MSDLKKNFKKVIKLPFRALIRKACQKINNEIYYSIHAKKIAKNPTDIDSTIFDDFKPFINFLFDINKKEYYIQEFERLGKKEQIVKQTDKLCNHIFNLLGSGDISLGEKIKWNQDVKTGFI